jgi:aldose 1-epimerase
MAGTEAAVLRDAQTDAEVRVTPELGNTCVSFRLGDWKVLDEPPSDEELLERASSYGIPVLFPWPNRVRNGRFTFGRRDYQVPLSPGMQHANHGLVRNRPWSATVCEATTHAAVVESEIRSADFPELADQYPSAFQLTVRYRLVARSLRIDARVTNVGDEPLPFGFGLHPYLRVPLGVGSRRAACELRVAAAEIWELDNHLPTGQRLAVSGRFDLRQFRALDDETYDDVFTALDAPFSAALRDPLSRREILVEGQGGRFRELVVFAPASRPVVCLEPYTCVTDALNLAARGIETGLRVLQPRERWTGRATIRAVLA